MSPLWPSIKRFRLTINVRAVTDPWYSGFLLRVGDGTDETMNDNFIRIPDDMDIPYTDKANPQNVVDAEIAVGQHAGKRVFLPRIPLCLSDNEMFLFRLKRKQFPIRLRVAMTINKAQGQTIPNVGVYLPESVFLHGQLYVALSRGVSCANAKVLVKSEKVFSRDGIYTSNMAYREVLCDG
ncbi:hypothetical protein OROGR_021243 [Orobanche gracilis]